MLTIFCVVALVVVSLLILSRFPAMAESIGRWVENRDNIMVEDLRALGFIIGFFATCFIIGFVL